MRHSLSILFIFLAFYNCNAQTEFGEMSIKTKDSKDSILANVSVDLYMKDSLIIKGLETDSNGILLIKNLLEGSYNIKLFKEKYTSSTITGIQVKSKLITFINFKLDAYHLTVCGSNYSSEPNTLNENGETIRREDIKHMPSRN